MGTPHAPHKFVKSSMQEHTYPACTPKAAHSDIVATSLAAAALHDSERLAAHAARTPGPHHAKNQRTEYT